MRITRSCICGSDLWPYKQRPATQSGGRIGHEFIGVVEKLGSEVATLHPGDVVVAPFLISDGTHDFWAVLECPTDEFASIAMLAAKIFDVSYAVVTVVDTELTTTNEDGPRQPAEREMVAAALDAE